MPITGLPNPQIHRLCKRCRQWFEAHEGAMCWPPKIGLLTWVHVTQVESTDQRKEQRFYCTACQDLNAKDAERFLRGFKAFFIPMLIISALAGAAWALGLVDMLIAGMRR